MGWNDLIGRRIGSYEIIEELGRGGTARVYRAYQDSPQRHVAIKVLLNDAEDRLGFVRRFERELEAVAQLNHPNIVAVYEAGELEDLVYLVMQCVNGGTFRQRLGQPLGVADACSAVIQVARALQHAHARGIVHRDVKPSNMLIDSDNDGRILLTDFGIAKLAGMRGLTKSGTTIGTPEYMAPEQAEGREIDSRADVYSLGCVLYEALAGRAPFVGASPVSVLYQQVHSKPDYIRVHNPNVPRELARILDMALAKRPEQRISSADSFAWALHPFTIARDHSTVSTPTAGWMPVEHQAHELDLRTGRGEAGDAAGRPMQPAVRSSRAPSASGADAPEVGLGAEGLDALFPDDPDSRAAQDERKNSSLLQPFAGTPEAYLPGSSLVGDVPRPGVPPLDQTVPDTLNPRPTVPLGALITPSPERDTQSLELPLTPEGQLDMTALMSQVEVAPAEGTDAQEWTPPPDLPPYEQWSSSEEVSPYTAWNAAVPAPPFEPWEDMAEYPPYMPYMPDEPEVGEVPSMWGDVHVPVAVATLDPMTPPPIWRPEEQDLQRAAPVLKTLSMRSPRTLAAMAVAAALVLALLSWGVVSALGLSIARGTPRSTPTGISSQPTATLAPTATPSPASTPTPTQQQQRDRQAAADLRGAVIATHQMDACSSPASSTSFTRSDAIWVSVCMAQSAPSGTLSVTVEQGSNTITVIASVTVQAGHSYAWAYYASNLPSGGYHVVIGFHGGTGADLPFAVQ